MSSSAALPWGAGSSRGKGGMTKARRSAAWADLKDTIRQSIRREETARKKRDQALSLLRTKFRELKASNAKAREAIRERARELIAKERRNRRGARESYAFRFRTKGGSGRAASTARRYTRGESDSLAVHNIDPALADLFIEMRREFSYDMEPDYRAEAFGEWVEENPEQVAEYLAQKYDAPLPEETEDDWRCNTAACKLDRAERPRAHDPIPF